MSLTVARLPSVALSTDFELYMPIRISPVNIKADLRNLMNTQRLSYVPPFYRRQDRLTRDAFPACYTGQSIYRYAPQT